jgi:energy-coupling factor transport system permease protein
MRDGFGAYHPAVNFFYFAAVIACAALLMHPVSLAVSLFGALAYAARLRGGAALTRSLWGIIPLFLFTALINPAFNHRGASVWFYLKNGNPVTLESIAYGFAAASAFVAVILWFSCFLAVVGSDKLVYLFGRLSPALALLFTMALRMVPRFFEQLAEVRRARALLGNGAAKGVKARAAEAAAVMSALASWSIEGSIVTADAMRARGYGLPGRTAYSPFVFTWRDGAAAAAIAFFSAAVLLGGLRGLLFARYFPTVKMTAPEGVAALIFAAHAALCALPLGISLWEDVRWKLSQSKT